MRFFLTAIFALVTSAAAAPASALDICTLSMGSSSQFAQCEDKHVCRQSEDGTKMLCADKQPIMCIKPLPTFYNCIRPDGTTYELEYGKSR